MKVVLLHLSDLHIRSSTDGILKRTDAIAQTLNRYLPDAAAVFIVVSGDIAYSGCAKEYEFAEKFLRDTTSAIEREKQLPISVIVVPGNHDCDFTKGGSVRKAVLDAIRKDGEEGIDDERITVCVQVQQAFEEFREKFVPAKPHRRDPLWMQYLIDVEGKRVLFDCLNVSWSSQLPEVPGQLIFPVQKYQRLTTPECVLRFVVLHHPLNWYNQATYHGFRALIRAAGHFVLSGHEHTQGAGETDDGLTGPSVYVEGAALQPHNAHDKSGFNVIDIDLDGQQYKCELFTWNGSEYQPRELQQAWSSYRQFPDTHTNEFKISDEFRSTLDDPGANFTHPSREGNLKLAEIYIYPDLEEIVEDGQPNRLVSASVLQDPEALGKGALIKGAEKAGKTALLHTLFRRYHETGYIPVLLRGHDISSASEKELSRAVEASLVRQYTKPDLNRWNNLPLKRKVLLFDDYGRTKVADRYRWRIISIFGNRFAHMLITADEMIDISEAFSPETADILRQFHRFDIRPFGHKLRHDLIRKWNCISEDHTRSSAELVGQVDRAEKVINSVLGKNLVPRVPLYLLTLLQSLETNLASDLQNSAFGYYYQYLITHALRKVNVRLNELDEFFGYCSQLAWFYHQSGSRELDEISLRGFSDAYSRKFYAVDFSSRLARLQNARLIDQRGNYYSFSYPYIYYFFLGKYLAEHLPNDIEVKNLVERYCGHLYVREYANAILFLTHHSKDPFIIESVAGKLRSLFSDVKPICLEEDTATLNDLVESTSKLVFAGGDPEANRRRSRELQDEVEAGQRDVNDSNREIDGELDLPSKLLMLFKTVEILGQILKNHYGRIENIVKLDLMREIYRGPLRALRSFLEAVEKDREAIITDIESFIGSKAKSLGPSERKKLARESLFEFIGMVTFGFLFKSSTAVGSEHLRDVAKELVENTPSTAFRLIELGTRLDAPTALPFDDIEKLTRDTSRSAFAHRLLQTIVLRHLYLFKTNDRDKQRLCKMLGVSVAQQRRIDVRAKDQKLTH